MSREKWIELGAQALPGGTTYMMSGDQLVPGTMNRITAALVIDAVLDDICAEEQERIFASVRAEAMTGRTTWSVECLTDRDAECEGCLCTCHIVRDLHQRVQALPRRSMFPPHAEDCPGRPGYRGICTCGDRSRVDWVPVDDVLALFGLDEEPAQGTEKAGKHR